MKHPSRFKPVIGVGFFILIMLILTGCHKSNAPQTHPEPSSYFRMNLGTEPPTLDPAEVTDLVSTTVISNILRGLTQYGNNNQIVPAVADHWTVNADGKRYVFHIRDNARWSDGTPVTANDFVYAWQRLLDPKKGAPYAFFLFDVQHCKDYYQGNRNNIHQLGFRAEDAHTLTVTLNHPVAYFLQILAFPALFPLQQKTVTRYSDTFTEAGHFVTDGPYTLAEWDHENQILLKPNPLYWGGKPPNNGIEMLMIPESNTSLIMYENNELDFVETTTSLPSKEVRRLKNRSDFHHQTLAGISYFGFNTQKKPFNDVRVRQAFIEAFDRTYIPKLFQSGEIPITSWIAPGLFAYNPHIGFGFNPQNAQALLSQAGYPNGTGFPTVELVYANTTPENRQIAEIAQYQWHHNLGVNVDVKNVEWKVFLKQLDDDPPQIYRLQWFVDYPDPDSFMNVFIADSGNNHSKWKNALYDQRVAQAASTLDPKKRLMLYNQAQKQLLEENACLMPLYVIPKSYLLKPTIHGFQLNTLNIAILDHIYRQ